MSNTHIYSIIICCISSLSYSNSIDSCNNNTGYVRRDATCIANKSQI